MAKYKVIDPKGFNVGEEIIEKGKTFELDSKHAVAKAGLHFGQIEASHAKDDEPKADHGKK